MKDDRTTPAPAPDDEPGAESPEALEPQHLPELPHVTRIVLLAAGSALLTLGLIGLALPVVPQTAFLLLGAALLSVASKRVHDLIERSINRWPTASRTFARLRHRIHRWAAPGKRGPRD